MTEVCIPAWIPQAVFLFQPSLFSPRKHPEYGPAAGKELL